MSSSPPSPARVVVLASQVGDVGGAAKATRLLCEALSSLPMAPRVELFVTLPPAPEVRRRLLALRIAVTVPLVNRGWRAQVPHRLLARQLAWSARRRRPSLIVCVGLEAVARLFLERSPAAPVFLWETTEALPPGKFVDPRIRPLLGRAAGILAPSATVERNLRSTYAFTGVVGRLPFWVEAPADPGPAHARTQNLLYVGRLDVDKGFAYLFEGFRRLRAERPAATLTVCGAGPVEPICALAAGAPGLEVRGFIDDAAYERAIAHCDAMVLASLHEGYPLSLLEACARRRPVIATTVGSIPEVFADRACALLVPPRDGAALFAGMQQLFAEDDAQYAARSADARALFDEVSGAVGVRARLEAVCRLATGSAA